MVMVAKFKHNHVQETPSAQWNIQHNLNTMSPITDCIIEFEGERQKAIPYAVTVVDSMNLIIEWTSPRAGSCSIA